MRRAIAITLGLAVSAVCLWLALRGVPSGAISAALVGAELAWAAPLLLLLVGFCITKAWRWALLLGTSPRRNLVCLTHAVLAGYAMTSILPLQLGELVRVWGAASATDTRMAPVAVSVALERVLDLFAVLLVVGTLLLLGTDLPPQILSGGAVLAAGALLLLATLTVYVSRTETVLEAVERMTGFLPTGWRDGLQRHLRDGAAGASALRRPQVWLALTVTSIAQWAFMAGCVAASCAALGLEVPWPAVACVLGLTVLGMTLPSGPGYVGTIQLAFTLALAPFGIDPANALAASVFYHLLICGSLVLAGLHSLMWLSGASKRRRPVREAD